MTVDESEQLIRLRSENNWVCVIAYEDSDGKMHVTDSIKEDMQKFLDGAAGSKIKVTTLIGGSKLRAYIDNMKEDHNVSH